MKYKWLLLNLALLLCFTQQTTASSSFLKNYFNQGQSFDEWSQKCDMLPFLRANPKNKFKTALTAKELTDALSTCVAQQVAMLCQNTLWVSNKPKQNNPAFRTKKSAFKPFVQRLIVPTNAQIIFHGDLHGDIHSLIATLKKLHHQKLLANFIIQEPELYLVFLGDYVDRGLYGSEVIYTLLRLKIANPNRVFLIRGNHEDIMLNASSGFTNELLAKFNNPKELINNINQLYNVLPVALYLGCNHQYLQCCHGGMEIGFNTHTLLDSPEQSLCCQWLGNLMQKKELAKAHSQCFAPIQHYFTDKPPTNCFDIGFMWNDFVVEETKKSFYDKYRGFSYNKEATHATLKLQSTLKNKTFGVIRAHQHAPELNLMMQSLLRVDDAGKRIIAEQHRQGLSTLWDKHNKKSTMWDGIVCTLLVSPDSIYGQSYGIYPGFDYDTYATLTTAEKLEDWDLQVSQVPIIN